MKQKADVGGGEQMNEYRWGMTVSVFRDSMMPDTTLGGVTATHDRCILAGEGIPRLFEVSEDVPGLKIVRRIIRGKEYLHAEPLEPVKANHVGWIFGGNLIYCSDSRFPNDYPIKVHDRQESRELNERLSA